MSCLKTVWDLNPPNHITRCSTNEAESNHHTLLNCFVNRLFYLKIDSVPQTLLYKTEPNNEERKFVCKPKKVHDFLLNFVKESKQHNS